MYKKYLIIDRSINGGSQKVWRFPNGYGASLVNHSFSYGLELAVLVFEDKETNEYHLTYDTPITDDVIGHLEQSQVEPLLTRIKNLEGV